MNISYPREEISLLKMFKLSFRFHLNTLRYALFPILFLAFCSLFFRQADNFIANATAILALKYLSIVIFFFFFSAALYNAHQFILNTPCEIKEGLKKTVRFFPKALAVLLLYLVGIKAITFGMHFFKQGVLYLDPSAGNTIIGLLVIIKVTMILLFIFMFAFSYPLVAIDQTSISKSFYNSILLSEKNKFGVLILFFIIALITSFLNNPGKIATFFQTYHLMPVYDLFILFIFIPCLINLLLLMINDSKRQFEI